MPNVDIQVLTQELQNDPQGLGYAAPLAAGQLGVVADLLNARRAGNAVSEEVPSHRVAAAVDPAEFAARTASERAWLQFIVSPAVVDFSVPALRTALGVLFPAGTATRTALAALATRQGSRAEALFGVGTAVTPYDVGRALGRG